MEILSPLTKLLRWERSPKAALSPRSVAGQPLPSKTAAVRATGKSSAHDVFRQLLALSPKDLQRFVSQHLPFLNDPYFAKSLAQRLAHTALTASPQGVHKGARDEEGFKKISESRLVRDQAGGFWKTWSVPVAFEGRLAKVTIYLSQKRKQTGKRKHKNRIILKTELDHTGPIEIEADVDDNSLLLALRTTSTFSLSAQTGIRERFLQILHAVSMQGSINFYTVSSLSMDALEPQSAWEVEL